MRRGVPDEGSNDKHQLTRGDHLNPHAARANCELRRSRERKRANNDVEGAVTVPLPDVAADPRTRAPVWLAVGIRDLCHLELTLGMVAGLVDLEAAAVRVGLFLDDLAKEGGKGRANECWSGRDLRRRNSCYCYQYRQP